MRDAGLLDGMHAGCALCLLVAWRACRGGVALRGSPRSRGPSRKSRVVRFGASHSREFSAGTTAVNFRAIIHNRAQSRM